MSPKEQLIKYYSENTDKVKVKDLENDEHQLITVRGYLTRHAHRRLHNWMDAEDAVQDAFTNALAHIDTFEEGRSLPDWVFIILTNCINRKINERSQQPEFVEANDELVADVDEYLLSPVDVYISQLLEEQEEHFTSYCKRISQRDASVVTLYFKYGHSLKSVAALTDTKEDNVKRILAKHRKAVLLPV